MLLLMIDEEQMKKCKDLEVTHPLSGTSPT